MTRNMKFCGIPLMRPDRAGHQLTMEALEAYDYENGHRPIAVNQECSLYGILRDSFMTFYEGSLYVGCFMEYSESVIARYEVDGEGNLVTRLDDSLEWTLRWQSPWTIRIFLSRPRE